MRQRIFLALAVCLITGLNCVKAQTGLKIAEFFTPEFQENPSVTSIEIQGGVDNDKWGDMISLYRSISTDNPALVDDIEKSVKTDGRDATSRSVSMEGGHITYGWYSLPQGKNKLYRYILFINRDRAATLIYIEGIIEPMWFKSRMLNKTLDIRTN